MDEESRQQLLANNRLQQSILEQMLQVDTYYPELEKKIILPVLGKQKAALAHEEQKIRCKILLLNIELLLRDINAELDGTASTGVQGAE